MLVYASKKSEMPNDMTAEGHRGKASLIMCVWKRLVSEVRYHWTVTVLHQKDLQKGG